MDTEQERQELLPCPFCGRQPKQFGNTNAYRCEFCGKNSGWMSINDWNTRTANKELEDLKERYSIACKSIEVGLDSEAKRLLEAQSIQLRTLEREKVELEKEIEFYKASMVRIANSQDITDPIELIARAKNNEQTYVDILLEVIAERKNFLTAQLTQMAEKVNVRWSYLPAPNIELFACRFCNAQQAVGYTIEHKPNCIVLLAQSILEKKGEKI